MKKTGEQLKRIAALQCSQHKIYSDGLFPAVRTWLGGLYSRKDNTAFFSACIGFTLLRYMDRFTDEEALWARSIIDKMKPAFARFKNKDNHSSYNFWMTIPGGQFPGGYIAYRLAFFMIPDDIDDSALIHLVLEHSDKEKVALREKMIRYALGVLKWPDRPVKGFEHFKAYNTFFVKNMPSSFDVCALCNTLYFILYNKFNLQEQDEHSLQLIAQSIAQDDYLNRPYQIAPYYPNSILIIYHYIRLIVDLEPGILLPYKDTLLEKCYELYNKPQLKAMEKLILQICILKLGGTATSIAEPTQSEKSSYPFFVAGLLGEVKPKWLRALGFLKFSHIQYHALAYAEVLWLEYLLLLKERNHQL